MKKNFLTRVLTAAVSMSVMMIAGGCGNESPSATESKTEAETASSETSASDDSLEKVLDSKKLVLGLDASFPPMGYTDENGNITGFDIDLAQEVCDRLGIELVKQPINWDNKQTELNSGNIDCIWNGMSVTSEREEAMCLSEPYMKNSLIFVVPTDSEIISADELKDKKVGVQKGSTAEDILTGAGLGVEIVGTDDNMTALEQMQSGELQAVFIDSVAVNYLVSSNGMKCMFLPDSLMDEDYAIGFRKEDAALRNEIQNILHSMKEDGIVAKISEKWFGGDITTIE